MSTATKILLTVAAACLLLGIVITVVFLITNNGKLPAVSVVQNYVKNNMGFSDTPDIIELSDVSRNLRVFPSSDDNVSLVFYSSQDTGYSIKNENGKLTIKYCQSSPSIVLNEIEDHGCILYLPRSYSGELKFITTSGDVSMQSIHAGETKISTVSGDVMLYGDTDLGKTSISTTSGDLELENAVMESLTVQTVSGDTECAYLTLSGDLKLTSTSGEAEFRALTAENVSIGTVSGEVKLSLTALADSYRYQTSTVSGKVSVPQSNPAAEKTVKISTTSGDISVSAARASK